MAAMAFGPAGASARRTRCPSTSTPRTSRTSLKVDGSTTSISRNSTSWLPGTGLVPRCSRSLAAYSGGVVAGLMPVREEVQFAVVGQVVGDEPAGGRVELDPVGPQLGGPRYPRD